MIICVLMELLILFFSFIIEFPSGRLAVPVEEMIEYINKFGSPELVAGAKCNLDIFNPTIEYKLINSKLLKNISLPACRPIS